MEKPFNQAGFYFLLLVCAGGWLLNSKVAQPAKPMPRELVLVPAQSNTFGFKITLPQPIVKQATNNQDLTSSAGVLNTPVMLVGFNNGDTTKSSEFSILAYEVIKAEMLDVRGQEELLGNSIFSQAYNLGASARRSSSAASVQRGRLSKNFPINGYLVKKKLERILPCVDLDKERSLAKNGCPGREYTGKIKGDQYRVCRNQTFITKGLYCVELTAVGSPEWVQSAYVKQIFNSFQPQN